MLFLGHELNFRRLHSFISQKRPLCFRVMLGVKDVVLEVDVGSQAYILLLLPRMAHMTQY